jgi:hypothetical protein
MSKDITPSNNTSNDDQTQIVDGVSQTNSLTGMWKANDGGTYYIMVFGSY